VASPSIDFQSFGDPFVMIMDALLTLADGQAVTASAPSTHALDLGADRDIGAGTPLELVVSVEETATAAGSATLSLGLETDDDPTFATVETLATSPAYPLAALTRGATLFRIAVPRGTRRYLRLGFTVADGPLTAGRFSAALVATRQDTTVPPAVT